MTTIGPAITPADVALARALFEEYAASLPISLCFQGFGEELASLPGAYAPPSGRLLLAWAGEEPGGCAALRPIRPGVCEMKRLFVRPGFRGLGIGRLLAEAIVREARQAGYRTMHLDTLPSMHSALGIYEKLGFHRCPAYYPTPFTDTVFMELAL